MSWSSAFASKVETPLLLSVAVLLLPACEGERCATLAAECTPLYEPTFENVYTNTLGPSCAVSGASCHASQGRQAGLDFGSVELAHAALSSVVRVDEPACSPLLLRLESAELGFSMPPGRQLSSAERCSIRRWIEAGAGR